MLILSAWPLFHSAQVVSDSCLISTGDFRSQTQGGWGIEECTGENPGCYRDAMFDIAFPEGLALGCAEGDQWLFTGPEAVADFLPQGGTAALLGQDAINPTGSFGVLTGQLLAAKLSIGFDAADPAFGASDFAMGELNYTSGPFEGWSVAALVMMADMVIGGCMPSVDNLSSLVEALTVFNEAFVDGMMVSGSLVLPGCEDVGNGGGNNGDDGNGGGGNGGGGNGGGGNDGGGNGGGGNDGGGNDGGGNDGGGSGGPGGDDCESDPVCTIELTCPSDTTLECTADTAAAATGLPALSITCCPVGAPLGSSECTTTFPEVNWTWTDVETGSCPVTVVRTFTTTLTGVGLDTTIACSQLLFVSDTTAPAINCPPDVSLLCGESLDPANTGFATATDACGTVVVSYTDFTLTSGTGSEEGYSRFWTATDGCGNVASCLQTITVPDATAPSVSLVCPPDTTLDFTGECAVEEPLGLFGEPEVTVTDAQDLAPVLEVSFTDAFNTDCSGEIIVTRTWLALAMDNCGNEAQASCEQTLTFLDAEPPVFISTCDVEDGQVIEVCCSPDGTIDIPSPCLITASDNCGVNISFEESYVGYAPEPGAQQACAATQPIAFESGLTCEGDTTHALRLFCFPGTDEEVAFFTAVGAGEVQYFDDSSWSLTWSVMALDNSNAGFDLSVQFSEGLDWAGWNARDIPSGFKGDCADLAQAQTWMYYILSEGTLTGWGEYTGSTFTLTHQPESKFYGAQLGEGANQHNAQYGFGSTLTYSGTFVENGVTVASDIHCCGDLHGELECCLPFTITRTYTATDCAGNSTQFSYQVTSGGDPCTDETEGAVADGTEPLPEGRTGAIILTGMAPNPAGGDVSLRFAVEEDMDVEATLLNLSGQVVQPLGEWPSEAGQEYTIDFQVGELPAGLYQLRLASSREKAIRSLLVVH